MPEKEGTIMSRKCSICGHPKRKDIDKALAEPGSSIRGVSRKYKLSEDALKRHLDNGHIADKLIKAQQVNEIIEADDFLSHLQKRRTRFNEMADEAKKEFDPHLELKVYQIEGKYIEMEGRAVGAFTDKLKVSSDGKPLTTNVTISPKTLKAVGDLLAKGG